MKGIVFQLVQVDAAALDSLASIESLCALHERNSSLLPPQRRAKDSVRSLFSYIEQHPIYAIGAASEALDVSYNSVASATKKLVDLGIVKEVTNAARNRVFAYEDYLGILREGTE